MDLFSRKIVGHEVYETESSIQLASVVSKATLNEKSEAPRILHSDNGSPMKGQSLLELCYSLGIINSYSRPRVSNDNVHIESLFKTTKYCPAYPFSCFIDINEAREWIQTFVKGYNQNHMHS
jgi:putative transposase